MKRCVLGIDTSNYTTSLSLVGEDLSLIANIKVPLPVKEGERGLRQSDAVFAHVKNFPVAFEQLSKHLQEYEIAAVGVSTRPRNQEGSYMPCFLVGHDMALGIATTKGIPLYTWSHQCGHITAALYGANQLDLMHGEFGAFHISGGTTELVRVTFAENGYHAEVVGGSKDLHAGQAIDRIGVAMGLPFPAGPHMELLASTFGGKVQKRSPKCEECYIHLSGLENLALDLYRQTQDKQATAAFVYQYVGAGIEKMSQQFREKFGDLPLVYAGGVMSSAILQKRLSQLKDTHFAPAALSADNAVGIAVNTALKFFS